MPAPCYICGADAEIESLCTECYNKEHPLATIQSVVSITICKKCGAIKVPGGWKTIDDETQSDSARETYVGYILQKELKVTGNDVELSILESNRLDRVLQLELIVTGHSHPDISPHTETLPLEVRFNYATCDTCSMMSGGYYESTLQIRAQDRLLSDDEKIQIIEIAREKTYAEYGRDAKAFILQIDEIKFGLDLFIGSESLCKKIADEIQALFLAERQENYKLIGQEKGGKDKFRITIVLRLPRFSIGDIIKVKGNLCEVRDLGKGGLSCFDLENKGIFTISQKSAKWKTVEFVMPQSEKRKFMVVSNVYGQPVQIMDSMTYETREIQVDESHRDNYENGSIIEVIEFENRIYPIRMIPRK